MTDVFDENDETHQSPSTIAQVDPDKDYLAELVGEGKKFAEVSDLARGKAESDAFIEQLKQENASFREKLQEATTYDKLMNELKTAKTNDADTHKNNSSNQNNPSGEPGDEGVNVTQEQIEQLLERKLQERQAQTDKAANVRKVSDGLVKMFGNDAQTVLKNIGETNGLSVAELKELAAQRPQVVLSLAAKLEDQSSSNQKEDDNLFGDATPRTSTDQFRQPEQGGVKNQSFFDKMRTRDPKKYFSKETELEMHRLAMKDPERFFNN